MKGSGVVFTHGEGISTPHARPKGRQPLIECANMTLILSSPSMVTRRLSCVVNLQISLNSSQLEKAFLIRTMEIS